MVRALSGGLGTQCDSSGDPKNRSREGHFGYFWGVFLGTRFLTVFSSNFDFFSIGPTLSSYRYLQCFKHFSVFRNCWKCEKKTHQKNTKNRRAKTLENEASRDLIWYPKSSLGAARRAPGGSPRPPEGTRTISKKTPFGNFLGPLKNWKTTFVFNAPVWVTVLGGFFHRFSIDFPCFFDACFLALFDSFEKRKSA